jgi:hypothetical protein
MSEKQEEESYQKDTHIKKATHNPPLYYTKLYTSYNTQDKVSTKIYIKTEEKPVFSGNGATKHWLILGFLGLSRVRIKSSRSKLAKIPAYFLKSLGSANPQNDD